MSLSYKSSSNLKPLALSHCNAGREKLLFCTPQLTLPCPACCQALLTWDWAELSTVFSWCLPYSIHIDGSVPSDSRSDFCTSTSSITSFIANWFLWGFKRFLQKAAPENNSCHVGSSQQSASGLNLIPWHTQCISNNFGGKKTQQQKNQNNKIKNYLCVLGHYMTRRTNPWDWILNDLA